jgi:large subunit ribosomal protein L34
MLSKTRNRRRLRRHGFLKRMRTAGGKNVLNARRSKGRAKLVVVKSK